MSTRRPRALAGPLDAAGGPAAWCRGAVRATAAVHQVDAGVAAVCAARPRPLSLAPAPLLGACLTQVVERRPAPAEPEPEARRSARVEPPAPAPGRTPVDCPPGERPRPRRVEPAEPAAPSGRVARPAVCPPERRPDVPRVPPSPGSAAPRVGAARLRALAGDAPVRGLRELAPTGARAPWPATPRPPASTPAPADRTGGDLGTAVARRVAERLGGRVDVAALRRARVRATGPAAGLTVEHLRALATGPGADEPSAVAPRPSAALPSADRSGPAVPPPAGPPERSRRFRRERRRADAVGAASPPATSAEPATPRPARRRGPDAGPLADGRPPSALARWAEPTSRPPRLGDGPLADDTPAARGLAWTGTGPATADVRAATTSLGLAEPDLELVMTRILDDAARRHGIEV